MENVTGLNVIPKTWIAVMRPNLWFLSRVAQGKRVAGLERFTRSHRAMRKNRRFCLITVVVEERSYLQ